MVLKYWGCITPTLPVNPFKRVSLVRPNLGADPELDFEGTIARYIVFLMWEVSFNKVAC